MNALAGDWADYLARYHEANPGITEDLLVSARDAAGRTAYDWLLEAVPSPASVVDLACGNAPVIRRLSGGGRAVGVDRSAGELARARATSPEALLVRADAAAVPLASATAEAVTASMALMVLHPLEDVLAEVARLLRPRGVFAATVPLRPLTAGSERDQLAELMAQLGQTAIRYPEPLTAGSVAERFAGAGLRVVEDSVGQFVRAVQADEAELVVRSFYAPNTPLERVESVVTALRKRAASGPVAIPYRIRRLVALRSGPVGS